MLNISGQKNTDSYLILSLIYTLKCLLFSHVLSNTHEIWLLEAQVLNTAGINRHVALAKPSLQLQNSNRRLV